jgi:hypothetical protein
MAGLAILKHMHDLSDEVLCERWVENPYFQLFCDGMDGPGAISCAASVNHQRDQSCPPPQSLD